MRMPIARGTSAGQPSWTRPLSPIRGTENGWASTAARVTRRAANSGWPRPQYTVAPSAPSRSTAISSLVSSS
jgi:hypothetical protein